MPGPRGRAFSCPEGCLLPTAVEGLLQPSLAKLGKMGVGRSSTMPRLSPVRTSLLVTSVETDAQDAAPAITRLKGLNKGRPWSLTVREAASAVSAGLYNFYVELEGERWPLSVTSDGRLQARTRSGADALQLLAAARLADG